MAKKFGISLSDRVANSRKIIQDDRNVWQSVRADKFSVMVDAKNYFECLTQVLDRARRSIWIIGWDFNPDIYLCPERPRETLGDALRRLVEARPELEIRILVWSMGPIYSGKSLSLFRHPDWSRHPRIHLQFDSSHPLRGSHHQKMVAIDETIAFIGGIDLTARRWDDSRHLAENPLRVTPSGDPYEPVHDLQAAVTGPAAHSITDLARRRWERATGDKIPAKEPVQEIWPQDLAIGIRDCTLGISLTEPGFRARKERRQAMRLTIDALRSAQRHIYIETQYFAFFGIAEAVEQQLRRPEGPEVLVILTRASHGFLEKIMMGGNRDRLIRRLKQADRFGRIRFMYPVVPAEDGGEQDVLIHSKLLIVDNRFLRLGSSNLNNRSEGLDTEADIAVEAEDTRCETVISGLRNRLMAEHLDASENSVAAMMAETGMLATVARLNIRQRGLRDMPVTIDGGSTAPVVGTDLVDPKRPYWPLQRLKVDVSGWTSWLQPFLARRK